MALTPGTRLGSYEIVSPLGSGGQGEVYRARDTRLDRTVAVKVIPAELAADPERRERFEREARAAAALNHPHICGGDYQLRAVATGRKNWLFAGSFEGARLAATLYFLVQSCRLAEVDPFLYFRDVLLRVASPRSNRRAHTPRVGKRGETVRRLTPPFNQNRSLPAPSDGTACHPNPFDTRTRRSTNAYLLEAVACEDYELRPPAQYPLCAASVRLEDASSPTPRL